MQISLNIKKWNFIRWNISIYLNWIKLTRMNYSVAPSAIVHISKALAVKEFAYVEDMNSNYKNTMEDGLLFCSFGFTH